MAIHEYVLPNAESRPRRMTDPVPSTSRMLLIPFPPLCARSRTPRDVCAIGHIGNQHRRYQNAGIDRVDVDGTTQAHGHTEFLRYDLQTETYTCFTHRA